MIKTFTSNDVVRYFYGEISNDEKRNIAEAIAFDSDLQDVYVELEYNSRLLDVKVKPKSITIENILNYSKNFATTN